jgi:hypothetical protein
MCKSEFPTTIVKQEQKKKDPLKQGEFIKIRLLNDESIRWLYIQIEKIHLNNKEEN